MQKPKWVICTRCNKDTLASVSVCINCGQRQWVICTHCNKDTPVSVSICINCGQRIPKENKMPSHIEEDVLLEANGHLCKVQLFKDRICVKVSKLQKALALGAKSEREIPIADIRHILFRRASFFLNGHIHFSVHESQEIKGGMVGMLDILRDGNTVTFELGQQKTFESLKIALEQRGIRTLNEGSSTINAEQGMIMEAEGVNGILQLFENKIKIKREGFLAFLSQGVKGDKEIFISQISAIQFKNAGSVVNGYIEFSFLGGTEGKRALFGAAVDENSIMFGLKQQDSFESIKKEIEKQMTFSKSVPRPISNLDELEKLASLRDKGVITEDEFNAKKKQLLEL